MISPQSIFLRRLAQDIFTKHQHFRVKLSHEDLPTSQYHHHHSMRIYQRQLSNHLHPHAKNGASWARRSLISPCITCSFRQLFNWVKKNMPKNPPQIGKNPIHPNNLFPKPSCIWLLHGKKAKGHKKSLKKLKVLKSLTITCQIQEEHINIFPKFCQKKFFSLTQEAIRKYSMIRVCAECHP